MFRIKSTTRVSTEFLAVSPDMKEIVIDNLVKDLGREMYRSGCFNFCETASVGKEEWGRPDELELTVEVLTLTPRELSEAIKTLHIIKSALPPSIKGHADYLHEILTKPSALKELPPQND